MNIRLLTSIASADYSLSYGEETEIVPQDEAKRLIAAGLAVEITEKKTSAAKKATAKKAK